MGQPGRNFVTTGPSAAQIAAFTGHAAMQPIRVYVGRAQADTPEERAEIALKELERQGGFDRRVLIIASPTGTGWLDPGAHDAVEIMNGGDTATVAVQYSYLQSPLALIFETRAGLDQASALVRLVHDRWRQMPADHRPKLYITGVSLGAWSSMYAVNTFRMIADPFDGALWAGPPFPSTLWNRATAARDPGSPVALPVLDHGEMIRFVSHYAGLDRDYAPWRGPRIIFLQYSTDPIVFYDPAATWREPLWMKEPRAPDISPAFRFFPLVTQVQLALDMALALSVPGGHGHAYMGRDYVRPWAEITDPPGWSDADSARLIALCPGKGQAGCIPR